MSIIVHIFSIPQIRSDGKRSEVIISVHGTIPVQFHDFAQILTKFLSHASIGVDVEATNIIEWIQCCAGITYAVNFPHHRRMPTHGIEIKFQGAVKKSQPSSFVELQNHYSNCNSQLERKLQDNFTCSYPRQIEEFCRYIFKSS